VTQDSIITCYTLFNIPDRGNRSTIRNWNTLIQTLSLRTQPNIINFPTCEKLDLRQTNFGSKYKYSGITADVWSFSFSAENILLYANDDDPIGELIKDSNLVPMMDHNNIIVSPKCLVPVGEFCNIYYVYDK